MAEKEKRQGRGSYFEFESTEEREAFLRKCNDTGRKGATVIKLLIKGFMEGKFNLD